MVNKLFCEHVGQTSFTAIDAVFAVVRSSLFVYC